jgi:two-component system, response regulator PdtaR
MSSPAESSESRGLVLVVEDEVFIAMELAEALTDGGYLVLGPCGTINDALDLIDSRTPCAAVLDVNLHGHRVTPLAIELKARGIPYLLASASSPAEFLGEPALSEVRNLGPTNLASMMVAISDICQHNTAELP